MLSLWQMMVRIQHRRPACPCREPPRQVRNIRASVTSVTDSGLGGQPPGAGCVVSRGPGLCQPPTWIGSASGSYLFIIYPTPSALGCDRLTLALPVASKPRHDRRTTCCLLCMRPWSARARFWVPGHRSQLRFLCVSFARRAGARARNLTEKSRRRISCPRCLSGAPRAAGCLFTSPTPPPRGTPLLLQGHLTCFLARGAGGSSSSRPLVEGFSKPSTCSPTSHASHRCARKPTRSLHRCAFDEIIPAARDGKTGKFGNLGIASLWDRAG
jgi:hypothetical protein